MQWKQWKLSEEQISVEIYQQQKQQYLHGWDLSRTPTRRLNAKSLIFLLCARHDDDANQNDESDSHLSFESINNQSSFDPNHSITVNPGCCHLQDDE
jgi:hypothetical protein